jgi:tetratricopeptide (TPR) repeat protein
MALPTRASTGMISILLACLLAGLQLARAEQPPTSKPVNAVIQRADVLIREGKPQEAVELLTQLVDRKGPIEERHLALISRGTALMALKKYDDALRDLEEIMHSTTALHSSKVSALSRIIGAHSAQLNYKAIVAETTQLLQMADEKELLANGVTRGFITGNRAFGYLYLNETAKALADCNEALSDPNLQGSQLALTYHTRASAYLATGKFAECAADLQRVLDNPDTQPRIRASARKYLDLVSRQQATKPSTEPTNGK